MIFAEFSGAPNHEIRFSITEAVWSELQNSGRNCRIPEKFQKFTGASDKKIYRTKKSDFDVLNKKMYSLL